MDFARYVATEDGAARLPAILTAINNFSGFQEAFSFEIEGFIQLLREGGDYGLYFALTSDRFPSGKVADLISRRIALQVADRMMYSVILDGRPDLATYDPVPGRGFFNQRPPVEVQIALPTSEPPAQQIHALQGLSSDMSAAWEGSRPAPIRMLTESVSLAEVRHQGRAQGGERVSGIVIQDKDMRAREFDLARIGSCFLIAGPPKSGKTIAVSTIAIALSTELDPSRFRFALVTPKRGEKYSLDALKNLPHCLGQAKTEKTLENLVTILEEEAEKRFDASPEDSYSAASILLLLDDFHLLSTRISSESLSRLDALARRAGDIRMTMLLTVPSTILSTLKRSADPAGAVVAKRNLAAIHR